MAMAAADMAELVALRAEKHSMQIELHSVKAENRSLEAENAFLKRKSQLEEGIIKIQHSQTEILGRQNERKYSMIKFLQDEFKVRKPLDPVAVAVRCRELVQHGIKGRTFNAGDVSQAIIDAGNAAAHHVNIAADTALFSTGVLAPHGDLTMEQTFDMYRHLF
jgi:hypothetical protein